jgi:hypothetical protein
VPAGASLVQVGVMFTAPDSSSTSGSFYADDLMLKAADSLGVNFLAADDFSEVLTFGSRNRGSDMGDIDGDGKMDIIATTGTGETVVRMEFMGGDPTSASRYDVNTIFESKGAPADRYYPLDISDNDLDGDGNLEVVLTNLYASNATQPQIFVLDYDKFKFDKGGDNPEHLAPNWSIAAVSYFTDVDTLFGHEARTAIGGMDIDGDGKKEVITTDYAGHRVVVFEYDADNNVFDAVWTAPVIESTNHGYNPRTVTVGDLDGDGRQEIVFPSSDPNAEGYHIYEWDGVVGSDNYGDTYASIAQVEIDICCAGDGPGTDSYGGSFRGDTDRIEIFDIDGDTTQELITAIRRGSPRGALIVSLTEGDNLISGSGGGLETWTQEYFTDGNDHGRGSPIHALPADLNGDGNYELINHHWNNMLFYNITSTDTGYAAGVDTANVGWYKATPTDQFSVFGGNAHDIDGDGNDEAYFAVYGWGFGANQSGDIYAVDYNSDDDVLRINEDHVKVVGTNIGQFIGDIGHGYDGDDRNTLFVGRTVPSITALKYIGGDPLSQSNYLKQVIYYGEHDVVNTTITIDSTGTDTTYSGSPWGFPSKIETNWGDELLDFDGDGKKELLVSYQSIADSLNTTVKTWDDSLAAYVSVTTKVANPKNWTFILLENGTNQTVSTDPIKFVLPDDYRLDQNYPNPFNPNTTIRYTIPINRRVSIKVYNITGQLVRTLIDNEMANAGTHKVVWNGKNNFGRNVSTGIYLYSLEWAGMKKVKRMTLVK